MYPVILLYYVMRLVVLFYEDVTRGESKWIRVRGQIETNFGTPAKYALDIMRRSMMKMQDSPGAISDLGAMGEYFLNQEDYALYLFVVGAGCSLNMNFCYTLLKDGITFMYQIPKVVYHVSKLAYGNKDAIQALAGYVGSKRLFSSVSVLFVGMMDMSHLFPLMERGLDPRMPFAGSLLPPTYEPNHMKYVNDLGAHYQGDDLLDIIVTRDNKSYELVGLEERQLWFFPQFMYEEVFLVLNGYDRRMYPDECAPPIMQLVDFDAILTHRERDVRNEDANNRFKSSLLEAADKMARTIKLVRYNKIITLYNSLKEPPTSRRPPDPNVYPNYYEEGSSEYDDDMQELERYAGARTNGL